MMVVMGVGVGVGRWGVAIGGVMLGWDGGSGVGWGGVRWGGRVGVGWSEGSGGWVGWRGGGVGGVGGGVRIGQFAKPQ